MRQPLSMRMADAEPQDEIELLAAAWELATGQSPDSPKTAVWWGLPIAGLALLTRLAQDCRAESPGELRTLARAVRRRSIFNFRLRQEYDRIWYAADDSLAESVGVGHYGRRDVDRLADRTLAQAEAAQDVRVAAVVRAARARATE